MKNESCRVSNRQTRGGNEQARASQALHIHITLQDMMQIGKRCQVKLVYNCLHLNSQGEDPILRITVQLHFPFACKVESRHCANMSSHRSEKRHKVAIVGGGPSGLGAAIELAKLPFVDWDLYEKRSRISEIGGGFTLQPQTWTLLEHNDAAKNINAKDYYRSAEGEIEQRR